MVLLAIGAIGWAVVILMFAAQNFIMFTLAGMDYRHSLPLRLFAFFALPLTWSVKSSLVSQSEYGAPEPAPLCD